MRGSPAIDVRLCRGSTTLLLMVGAQITGGVSPRGYVAVSRAWLTMGVLRRWKILIDGERRGRLRAGGRVLIDVPSGPHDVVIEVGRRLGVVFSAGGGR